MPTFILAAYLLHYAWVIPQGGGPAPVSNPTPGGGDTYSCAMPCAMN